MNSETAFHGIPPHQAAWLDRVKVLASKNACPSTTILGERGASMMTMAMS